MDVLYQRFHYITSMLSHVCILHAKVRYVLLPTVIGGRFCFLEPDDGVFSFGGVAITVAVAMGPSTPGERSGET